jgi:hypothetical protein
VFLGKFEAPVTEMERYLFPKKTNIKLSKECSELSRLVSVTFILICIFYVLRLLALSLFALLEKYSLKGIRIKIKIFVNTIISTYSKTH